MPGYTRQTWINDDPATPPSAARLAVIENGIYDAHYREVGGARHTAVQSIPNGVNTALTFNSTIIAAFGMHNPANPTRLTCVTAGYYATSGHVSFAGNANGTRHAFIRVNGTTIITMQRSPNLGASAEVTISVSREVWPMVVNDYVELVVYQDSGAALNVVVSANFSPEFTAARVG